MGKGSGCMSSSMKKAPPTSDEKVDVAADVAADVDAAAVAPVAVPAADAADGSADVKAEGAPPVEVTEAAVESTGEAEPVKPAEEVAAPVEPAAPLVKIYIVFYSMYGHIAKLAEKIKEGVDSLEGAEGVLFQVPETLPETVLQKMGAPPKPAHIPIIEPKNLVDADAVLFGIPTRFGMMCAQMKAFFDATGSLWQSQALAGKPAGFFFSTGTQGGGQETTAMTAISQLAHHAMLFVPVGYTFQGLFSMDVHGGSPYGSGTFAGDGTRVPLDLELELAMHQGKLMAGVAMKLKRGAY